MNAIISIMIAIIIGIIGQVLVKKGINLVGYNETSEFIKIYPKIFFSPYVISGALIYFGSTIFWVYALWKLNLSYAYPFLALSYVFILLASWIFLGENIPLVRWVGIIIICFGIYLVYKS